MNPTARILLIDDDTGTSSSLSNVLGTEGFDVTCSHRGDEGLEKARTDEFELVLTDLKMPGLGGLELIQKLHEFKPKLPIILMTAFSTTETAIQATKFGAYDYLIKPFDMNELLDLINKAVADGRLMTEPIQMGSESDTGSSLISQSRVMNDLYKEMGRVANSNLSVLILGETGTGKELTARAIYQHSGRAQEAFIAINCAAIPETLLESELFGHERGAFTGAEFRRIGRFEQAHLGTLFLDEIGDMPLATQAKLLRVLQEKSIQRLGGRDLIPVDVRIIAATHQQLQTNISEGKFREDLYYRLNTVVLKIPPLRDRPEDIPPLISHFIHRYSKELGFQSPGMVPEAIRFLQSQPFPGNVRELENMVRKALVRSREFHISLECIKELALSSRTPPFSAEHSIGEFIEHILQEVKDENGHNAYSQVVESVERELLYRAMKLSAGNQAQAARWLGLSRLTLREKLQRYGLHPSQGEHTPMSPSTE